MLRREVLKILHINGNLDIDFEDDEEQLGDDF